MVGTKKINSHEILKVLAETLLLNEGEKIKEILALTCKRTKVKKEIAWAFLKFLKKRGFIIVNVRGRYGFTVDGLEFLFNILKGKLPEEYLTDHLNRIRRLMSFYRGLNFMNDKNKPKKVATGNYEGKKESSPKYLTIDGLLKVLGTTIKHDNTNKLITFFAMLSAYTEDSQFNVSFRAPSSTGKSYIPIELSQYFPEEDVIMIAYSSPTSFYHDTGEWNNQRNAIIINLERKILIFLDQPHDQLLQRLRPLLSHDRKELLYKITDKREKAGLRTKNVIIIGFPSVIFCTGSLKIDEQEATRSFILSPETSEEKIREAIYLKALRKGNPTAFQEFLNSHPEREELKERIRRIKEAKIKRVIIRDTNRVVEEFVKKFPRLKPRHQRDIERIISLIQAIALLNFWYRERDEEGNIYANEEDIQNAFKIFEEIAESQELGIPPYIYLFFQNVIKPLWEEKNKDNSNNPMGLTRKEILAKYYEVYGKAMPEWFLKQEILPPLESAGLIYQDQDPEDKRRTLVYVSYNTPPCHSTYSDSTSEKYVESEGGEDKIAISTIEKIKQSIIGLERYFPGGIPHDDLIKEITKIVGSKEKAEKILEYLGERENFLFTPKPKFYKTTGGY